MSSGMKWSQVVWRFDGVYPGYEISLLRAGFGPAAGRERFTRKSGESSSVGLYQACVSVIGTTVAAKTG